jgi:hypothetical protein
MGIRRHGSVRLERNEWPGRLGTANYLRTTPVARSVVSRLQSALRYIDDSAGIMAGERSVLRNMQL